MILVIVGRHLIQVKSNFFTRMGLSPFKPVSTFGEPRAWRGREGEVLLTGTCSAGARGRDTGTCVLPAVCAKSVNRVILQRTPG